MSFEEADIVVDLIALAGGELVGRTRLYQQAYLLHRCGADFDLPFIYHQYGPYSFHLVGGLDCACAFGRIKVEERLGQHGIPYATLTLAEGFKPPSRIGGLSADIARERLAAMKRVSNSVLEIAATIVFLREEGGYPGRAEEETKVRKSVKATDERMARARALLNVLGLSATAVPA